MSKLWGRGLLFTGCLLLFSLCLGTAKAASSENMDNTRLYFAYGSNMDRKQMEERTFTAKFKGPARIRGYKFMINRRGVASIVPDPARFVEGILWEISPADEKMLDSFEGVAGGYYTKETILVQERATGLMLAALVYIGAESEPGRPREGYLEKIIKAAETNGFNDCYLKELSRWQEPPKNKEGV
ncbi:MAG TPA: gamma-glutamylcyclotransferase [Firmicutes bacterium]|nr:gamma-glutamylcyclotransferase [Bacillota bacterium]